VTPEEQAYGILTYLYGKSNLLINKNNIKVKLNNSKRIRYIYYNNEIVFTLRNNDGFLLPLFPAYKYIKNFNVYISSEIANYIKDGKSVPAKYILQLNKNLRANMEVFVAASGEVVAVGRLIYSVRELSLGRGYAVKPRAKPPQP
jgi:uncharacterized protein with predicted RNA binding PUA domain